MQTRKEGNIITHNGTSTGSPAGTTQSGINTDNTKGGTGAARP